MKFRRGWIQRLRNRHQNGMDLSDQAGGQCVVPDRGDRHEGTNQEVGHVLIDETVDRQQKIPCPEHADLAHASDTRVPPGEPEPRRETMRHAPPNEVIDRTGCRCRHADADEAFAHPERDDNAARGQQPRRNADGIGEIEALARTRGAKPIP